MAKEKIESLHQKLTPIILLIDFIYTDIPIDKLYFLDLALQNLTRQKFTQFYISVKENFHYYEKIISKYKIKYNKCVNVDFGDLMREIDNQDYLYEAYIIYPINYNITKLNGLLASFKETDNKMIMSVYLTNYSDLIIGMDDNEIIFYDRKRKANLFDTLDDRIETSVRKTGLPEVVAVGKEFLALYNENFEFMDIGELVETLCLTNIYKYKMTGYTDEPEIEAVRIKTPHEYYVYLMTLKNDMLQQSKLNNAEKTMNDALKALHIATKQNYYPDSEKENDTENIKYHFIENNKTKNTELDNAIIGSECRISRNVNIIDSVIGSNVKISEGVTIFNSFVQDGCVIEDSLTSSILLLNSTSTQKLNNAIQVDNQIYFDANMEDELMPEISSESCDVADSAISFHQDVMLYLDTVASEVIDNKISIEKVKLEVNLISIIWKASQNDLIDVFIIFISDFIKEENLDQSTIDLMHFFPIIYGLMDDNEKQTTFVTNVYNCLKMENKKNRKEAFVRLGYAMMDGGIIDKDVLNKSRIIKGNYFR